MVEDIVIGAIDLGFDCRVGQIGHIVANAAFLRSCVAQALRREDGTSPLVTFHTVTLFPCPKNRGL